VSTPLRLALFGAGLVVLFATSFVVAGAVVPADVVADRQRSVDAHGSDGSGSHESGSHESSSSVPPAASPAADGSTALGLSLEADGLQLGPIEAPSDAERSGRLAFRILDRSGEAVTDFDVSHEQRLHLIVVRADGSEFRHVHPQLAADGTWSLDWAWTTAGSHRVIADVVPSATGRKVTLARTVEVGGDVVPGSVAALTTTDAVDGFDVTVSGELRPGSPSELTVTVRRDGAPVRTIEPYLGSYGHLVVLREGDLAYLHVHPDQDTTADSGPAGPTVGFTAEAPGPGRYLLYFDFQVDGVVRTAQFVLDAPAAAPSVPPQTSAADTTTTIGTPDDHAGH
jgi:hypothetical protein